MQTESREAEQAGRVQLRGLGPSMQVWSLGAENGEWGPARCLIPCGDLSSTHAVTPTADWCRETQPAPAIHPVAWCLPRARIWCEASGC